MNKMQQQVQEWHRKFGVPVADRPVFIEGNRRALRVRLIQEELDELDVACVRGDLVEVADALADLLYVTFGTAAEFGLDMEPIFDEVQRSNMSKLFPDGLAHHRDDGKVLKGPNFKPPNIERIIDAQSRQQALPLDSRPLGASEGDWLCLAATESLCSLYGNALEILEDGTDLAGKEVHFFGVEFDMSNKVIALLHEAAGGHAASAAYVRQAYIEPAMAQLAQEMRKQRLQYCVRVPVPNAVELGCWQLDREHGIELRFVRAWSPGEPEFVYDGETYPAKPPRWINRFDIAVASEARNAGPKPVDGQRG